MSDNIPEDVAEDGAEPALTTADIVQAGRAPERAAEPRSFDAGAASPARNDAPLFPGAEADALRGRWTDIQAAFVDEPRRAVEQADGLVAEAIKKLAEMFADERDRLEGQWSRGDDVSTEDLRQALQRYRSFFTRLLSV